MGMAITIIRLHTIAGQAREVLAGARRRRGGGEVRKGHVAVYVVGERPEEKKQRFVVPIWYLKHPLFQRLLRLAEEEYEFHHPMGGLTLPCTPSAFLAVTSAIHCQ
ncbi:unnamed protein product [Cuscuta epithymum]|uniref:Uncharacterized protein n=1 Tax=Cuscuta epithymum TaxID=186058 RepID=A0AAV0E1L0_9ASTE|nr:unnamed protein product [Cuscuta epithymum]